MCSASSVAAILQANCDTSKLVMRSTPLLPASSACHTSGALFPTAQIIPIPVTTTRRCKLLWSFRVRVDVIHRVLDGADLLRVLVRDLDLKGFFESHDQLDRVERISAEVVHERRVGRHLALFHAQLFHNDLLYAFIYGCHEVSNLLWFRRPLGGAKLWPVAPDGARYFLALACCSMYDTASCTVRIFSASSSGISISKASSKAMTSSTVSSESAPRSSTNDALGVTSPSSTPSCSTMICFTRSSTDAMRSAISFSSACPGRRKTLACRAGGARYFLALACCSMYDTASCTVRIFSASSSGISISKASSKTITSSTVSSESAPRSSTKEAPGVTSASSTPNCSTMICFNRSSTESIDISCRAVTSAAAGKPVSVIAARKPCKQCRRLSGKKKQTATSRAARYSPRPARFILPVRVCNGQRASWRTTYLSAEAIEAQRGIALVDPAIADEHPKALARIELLLVLRDDYR